jgi:membrane-bound lytic murein transglycosylase D
VLARAEPRKPVLSKPAKAVRVSSTSAKSKGEVIKVAAVSAPKYHVVKPQETLYRVATLNGISVEKLRKLNKMGPNDNNIRPGQKLKVGV